jgi:hypothetical protein
MSEHSTYYLNNQGTRWVRMDKFGNKDKITLTTRAGQLVTRTVQFYEQWGNFVRIQITYKGTRMFVQHDTILED